MPHITCHTCGKRCRGDVLRVTGRYFHKECFKCAECQCSVETGGFFEKNGKVYCPKDYKKHYFVRCHICGQQVDKEVVSALNKTFHRECFRCSICRKYFQPGDRVTLISNGFYCKSCQPARHSVSTMMESQKPSTRKSSDISYESKTNSDDKHKPTNIFSSEDDEGIHSPTTFNDRFLAASPITVVTRNIPELCLSDSNATKKLMRSQAAQTSSTTTQTVLSDGENYSDGMNATDAGYTSCDPHTGDSVFTPMSFTSGMSMRFGEHFNPSYLRLQQYQQRNSYPIGMYQRGSAQTSNRRCETWQTRHFHRPQDSTFSFRKPKNLPLRRPTAMMFASTVSPCMADVRRQWDRPVSTSNTTAILPSNERKQSTTISQHNGTLSPVKEHPNGSSGQEPLTDDPLQIALEAVHMSLLPAAQPPHAPFPRAIEREDWPAPPDLSVLLMERVKGRHSRQQHSQGSKDPRFSSDNQTHLVHSHSGHLATTAGGQNLRMGVKPRQTTSELTLQQHGSRKQHQRFTRFAAEELRRDTTVTTTSGFEDGHSGERDGCSSCTGMDVMGTDTLLECSSVADSDFAASSSCYEDARSVLTEAGLTLESGMAKAIMCEQMRSRSCHVLPIDPVSASRSPSANVEPKLQTRYQRHEFASPSRDTSYDRQIKQYSLGYPMDYANVGNRHYHLTSGSGSSSSHAVNSMASALQHYDEIRPNYFGDLVAHSQKSLRIHSVISKDELHIHNIHNGKNGMNHVASDGIVTYSSHETDADNRISQTFKVNGRVGRQSSGKLQQPLYASTFTSSLSVSLGADGTNLQPVTELSLGGIPSGAVGAFSAGVSDWDGEDSSSAISVGESGPQRRIYENGVNEKLVDYRGLRPRFVYLPSAHTVIAAPSSAHPYNGHDPSNSVNNGHHRSVTSLPPMSISLDVGRHIRDPSHTRETTPSTKIIPYNQLITYRKKSIKGLDETRLETYLTDEDFLIVFNMPRDSFYILPEWKRNDLKRRVKLF